MLAAAAFSGKPVLSRGLQDRLSAQQWGVLQGAVAAIESWVLRLLGKNAATLSTERKNDVLRQIPLRMQVRTAALPARAVGGAARAACAVQVYLPRKRTEGSRGGIQTDLGTAGRSVCARPAVLVVPSGVDDLWCG